MNSVCKTCGWYEAEDRLGTISHRCLRPMKFRDGSSRVNVSCVSETDDYIEPWRLDGDKCGTTFKNWKQP